MQPEFSVPPSQATEPTQQHIENNHADVPDIVPASMLAAYAYCPRLAYIEWSQKGFVDNADTVEGRFQHRRVDDEGGELPSPDKIDAKKNIHARSVWLTAPKLGLTAKLDLLEADGSAVTPVEYKHGRVPNTPEHSRDSHRVQVCVQALVLRENGYTCDRGVLYYIASKRRIDIPIDETLCERMLSLLLEMRTCFQRAKIPLPLLDDARCERCSLADVCLPEEVNFLRREAEPHVASVRSLTPSRDDDISVHVHGYGTTVRLDGPELVVEPKDGQPERTALRKLSHITICRGAHVTTPTLHTFCEYGVPVSFCSRSGKFHGMLVGVPKSNIDLRRAQFATAEDQDRCLELARRFVATKIRNSRTILRRNSSNGIDEKLDRMKELIAAAEKAERVESLLGIEGTAARIYFGVFSSLLKATSDDGRLEFVLDERNRQPPRDPVNSMLSYLYSCLTYEVTRIALLVGFDPFMGFYHRPGYGRTALALDLMEEFRPVIVDSVVLSAVNERRITPSDFESVAGGVYLKRGPKGTIIDMYNDRLDELITHPLFDYKMNYRRVIETQAKLLGQFLLGQVPEYRGFIVR